MIVEAQTGPVPRSDPRLIEVLERLRRTVSEWEGIGISTDTILAGMMADIVPRLVRAYGGIAVSTMLERLACEVARNDNGGVPH